jgi:hypothetical protein
MGTEKTIDDTYETRIPPPKLRQAIFSAFHVAPMAGHTGFQKTFWKIAARYYWPNMAADIRQLTLRMRALQRGKHN